LEKQAIERMKRGDINGLEILVRKYCVQATRAAYLITRDRFTAEDIVQSAFIRVYERVHQFNSDRPFGPYFLRIVVNDATKVVSRRGRAISLDEVDKNGVSLADLLPDINPGPQDLAEQAELQQEVWKALGRLSPSQRRVIVLHYYLGFKDVEISERLSITLGTVKRRLHEARGRLRMLLGGKVGSNERP
jgi:RNA polymerase sigma-70 factor (ECF subfamily)